MHDPSRKLPGETAFSVTIVAISLFLFWEATKISGFESLSSPGSFPIFATGVMVISSAMVALKTLRLPQSDEHGWKAIFPGFVIFMTVMMGFYALALKPVGFLPTSFLFLMVSTKVMMRASIAKSALIAGVSLILVYVVFRLIFSVLMPEGIVPEREIIAAMRAILAGGAE